MFEFSCLLHVCFCFVYFSFGCARSALLRGLFSRGKQGLRLAVACGLLVGLASPSVAHRLRRVWYPVVLAQGLSGCSSLALEHRLSNSGKWALSLLGMWDLCRPRIEPVFPALAGVQHLLKQILSCHDNRISAFVIMNMLVV